MEKVRVNQYVFIKVYIEQLKLDLIFILLNKIGDIKEFVVIYDYDMF